MAKLTLTDPSNFNSATLSQIAANNALIEAAIEKTLSRDGTTPNQMEADLDLNHNNLLNVSDLTVDTLTAQEVFADHITADAATLGGLILQGVAVMPGTLVELPILDEDDFASDSATQAPSQQSTKAYVDAKFSVSQSDIYDTLADFQAANVPVDKDIVALRGYYAIGDTEDYIYLDRYTGKKPGMNILLSSHLFQHSLWTKTNLDVTPKASNMVHGVDKYFTKLTPTTTNSTHQLLQAVNFTNGQSYVASIKVRASGYNYLRIQFPVGAFGASQFANFQLVTGVVTSTSGSVTAGIESLGDNEYLCWAKGTATSTVAANLTYQILNNSAVASFAGDGTSGIYAADAQLDPYTEITQYVKTHTVKHDRRVVNGYVTSNDGARWRYSLGQLLTTKKFGAKADGIDTGTEFTGTNDSNSIFDAIGFASLNDKEVFISAGNHRVAIQNNQSGVTGFEISVGYNNVRLNGFGPTSVIFLDEDVDYYLNFGVGPARCFGTGTSSVVYPKDYWNSFTIRNFKFKGRFSHRAGRYGTFPFWVENFKSVRIDSIHYEDIRQGCTNTKFGLYYSCTNCRAERIGAGAIARPIEFESVFIDRNYARYTDDDPIDCSTGTSAIQDLYPVRQGAVITNNVFVETESLLCWGFRSGIVANNIMIRTHGGPIQLGYESDDAGIGPANGIICANNLVIDPLGRYDLGPDSILYDNQTANFTVGQIVTGGTSGATGTIRDIVDSGSTGRLYLVDITGTFQNNETLTDPLGGSALADGTLITGAGWRWFAQTAPAIHLLGSSKSSNLTTNAVVPGEYDSVAGAFLLPYTNQGSIAEWGAMNTGPSSAVASPGAIANKMTGNIVMRTLPTVSKYSDWGYGLYFNGFDGFQDPAVTDSAFREIGYGIWSGIRNVLVKDNISFGFTEAGFEFFIPAGFTGDRQKAFQDIWITGNQFVWSKKGIKKDNTASGGTFGDWDRWGVHIYDNLFDLDPFHTASIRNTDGSWDSDSGSDYRAISLMRLNGVSVGRNTFRNCYAPLKYDTDYTLHGNFFQNIVECDPAATGFSVSNKGVAYIERAGEAFIYQIFESDPTAGSTFRDFKNACVRSKSSIPTAGTYVAGHVVWNSNPSISAGKVLIGWLRLTTGTGHVANTDWVAMYVTNS